MISIRYAAAIAASLALSSPAAACTLCSCSVSTTGISFGAYDPVATSPKDASGNASISCTGGVLSGTAEITMSAGTSGNVMARQMAQGTDRLNYNIYTNSGRTSIWGLSGSGNTVSIPLSGLIIFNQSVPLYGRIDAHQFTRAGSYTDSVILGIIY